MSDSELELKWKGQKYNVDFDEFPNGLEQATLADLKEKCKRITGVPVNAMKLLASGGECFFLISRCSRALNSRLALCCSCDEGRIFSIILIWTAARLQSIASWYPT